MYEIGDVAENQDKAAITNNIITLIRASQKNRVPIDYDGIINNTITQYGADHPEVAEVKALLYSLRDTNPYK